MRIASPVPRGSGAVILHRELARHLPGYEVTEYSPLREFFPPAIGLLDLGHPALVHAPADYGVFVRRPYTPLVLTLHGYNLDPAFRPFATHLQRLHYATDLRYFMRRSLRTADTVIAVSETVADLAASDLDLRARPVVIPNGVDIERFRPASTARRQDRPVRVLFAGNLSRRKGGDMLLDIAMRLHADVRLVCASGLRGGERPFDHPRIEWLGTVSPEAMPELYRSCDIYLAPSVREGLSLAALEAMASGLPVIASRATSFPELVTEGEGGYLCAVRDAAMFAERINVLAESAGRRAAMGERNRQAVVEKFDARLMVARYREIFAQYSQDGARAL